MKGKTIYLMIPLALLLSSFEKVTKRELQFENEKLKVWKTTIYPNSPLAFHRHESDRVVIGLKGGRLLKVEEDGSSSDLIIEDQKTYFFEADPENQLHADINTESYPIEVIVMELKK